MLTKSNYWMSTEAEFRVGAKDGSFIQAFDDSTGLGIAISSENFLAMIQKGYQSKVYETRNYRSTRYGICPSFELDPSVDSSSFMTRLLGDYKQLTKLTVRELPMVGKKTEEVASLLLLNNISEIELSPKEQRISPSNIQVLLQLYLWNPAISSIKLSSQTFGHGLKMNIIWGIGRKELDSRKFIRDSMTLSERCLEVVLQSLRPLDESLEPSLKREYEELRSFITTSKETYLVGTGSYTREMFLDQIKRAAKIRTLQEVDGVLVETTESVDAGPSTSAPSPSEPANNLIASCFEGIIPQKKTEDPSFLERLCGYFGF